MSLLLFCISCKEAPPQPPPPPPYVSTVQLAIEDTGVTDVWLKLKFSDTTMPRSYQLRRDNAIVLSGTLTTADTVLLDTAALPKRTYQYKAYRLNATVPTDSSASLSVTTMDTTSHNFAWQIDTLGVASSSLYDVAIINDTLAYAVGEMYLRDSMGQIDPRAWNAAKWNGQRWELKRIPFVGPCSAVDYPPLKAIWAFSQNSILVTNGGSIVTYDGSNATMDCRMNSLLTGAINKIHANSLQDVYAVGNNGCIVHYNGSAWQRVESGTTLGLTDIWRRSATELYACGLHYGDVRGVVLKGNGTTWQTMITGESADTTGLFHTKLYGITEGIWMDEHKTLYAVGNLMYQYKRGRWGYVTTLPGNFYGGNPSYLHRGYLHAVRGNASNDMFAFGEINTLRHFNGASWAEVGPPYYPLKYEMFWYRCSVKGNRAMGVGKIGGRASVIRLWR